jgi:nickel-dependent lactate racemase
MPEWFGKGQPDTPLTEKEVFALAEAYFAGLKLDRRKVLIIIPDNSRTAPIDLLFQTLYRLLAQRVKELNFLIALGTHPPLSEAEIYQRVGLTKSEHLTQYPRAHFFNHHWKDPQQLVTLGVLSAAEIESISGGLLKTPVPITVNRLVTEHDLIIIVGPVFPHEVVGFSGGYKYFFPGIAGQQIIDFFHWLGALITNVAIIGKADTPVRKVIDRAAQFIDREIITCNLVMQGHTLVGMYIGAAPAAWRQAVDLSARVNIVYKDKPFRQVLSCAPAMYTDLWTGGKCMYKLEPVVADGGELIIYASHIKEVSVTHGSILHEIGYHVRDYYLHQWDRFKHYPGGVLAHSTHVKGLGTYENGLEQPRITVTLATGIPEAVCRQINLGYRDPATIELADWQNREAEGILVVPKAGEMLYRLRNNQ